MPPSGAFGECHELPVRCCILVCLLAVVPLTPARPSPNLVIAAPSHLLQLATACRTASARHAAWLTARPAGPTRTSARQVWRGSWAGVHVCEACGWRGDCCSFCGGVTCGIGPRLLAWPGAQLQTSYLRRRHMADDLFCCACHAGVRRWLQAVPGRPAVHQGLSCASAAHQLAPQQLSYNPKCRQHSLYHPLKAC